MTRSFLGFILALSLLSGCGKSSAPDMKRQEAVVASTAVVITPFGNQQYSDDFCDRMEYEMQAAQATVVRRVNDTIVVETPQNLGEMNIHGEGTGWLTIEAKIIAKKYVYQLPADPQYTTFKFYNTDGDPTFIDAIYPNVVGGVYRSACQFNGKFSGFELKVYRP